MGELSKLPNIGKAVEAQLIQVGIETPEALREIGAKAAWLKIQEIDPSACIHRLLALEGAIQGVKKTELPDAVKADLKAFYQEHKLKKWEPPKAVPICTPTYSVYHICSPMSILSFSNFCHSFLCIIPSCKTGKAALL